MINIYDNKKKQKIATTDQDWVVPHIEVIISPSKNGASFGNGEHNGKKAIINSVSGPHNVTIRLLDANSKPSSEVMTISAEYLQPVRPEKKQNLIVIAGEYKGQRGQLIGIDVGDGIVKLEGGLDFKIMTMSLLAKLADA